MNAWIFDVDGVITNLDTRKVEHPKILEKIIEKLQLNEPVGIITGRALPWLQERVLNLIEKQVKNLFALDNLCIEAEFGGISVIYDHGQKNESIEANLSISLEVLSQLEKLVKKDFSDVMFVDSDKRTHFTAEMKEDIRADLFKQKKKELVEKLKKIIDEHGLSETVEIHEDAIATNVKNNKLNKYLAANKFLKWLRTRKIEPELFYVFGDSTSDLQIGEKLHSQGKKVKFVYTGKDEDLGKLPFEVIRPSKRYDEGTLEYLSSS